jgi:hypothetical protein
LKFIKDNFNDLYTKLLPYLNGNEVEFDDEETPDEVEGEFVVATFNEYDNKNDYMSDNGIKLEDIWSQFP